MRGDGGQKFPQRQRHDKAEVVAPGDVDVLPDAPQVEERPAVHGDAGQLYHRDRHRVGELAQYHLADHVVAARHHVPEDAEKDDRERLAHGAVGGACRPLSGVPATTVRQERCAAAGAATTAAPDTTQPVDERTDRTLQHLRHRVRGRPTFGHRRRRLFLPTYPYD